MAAVEGAATNAILKVGGTYGTAVNGTTGDKLALNSLTESLGETVLSAEQLGAGLVMAKDATKAAISPTINLGMYFGFRNLADLVCYGFWNSATVSSEITVGQGDYLHRIKWGTTPSKWLTLAHDRTSDTVTEYPSCSVRSLTINVNTVPGYVTLEAEMLGNTRVIAATENSNAELASATVPTDTELVTAGFDSSFLVDVVGGTLGSPDQIDITSYSLKLTRPLEFVGEIRNANGNAKPRSSGLFTGELTVTLKDNAQSVLDFFSVNDAEAAYKCRLQIEGTQIGSGSNRTLGVFVPRMKLIQSPVYDLTETGHNPVSLTFTCLAADSAPADMNDVYPYVEITNNRSTVISA